MQKIVITDIHEFAPNETTLTHYNPQNPDEILIGDIVDRANCKKSDLDLADRRYEYLKEKYKDRYIDGNHCRKSIVNHVLVYENTVFAHGDFESWGDEKAIAYRSKPPCAGFFKRAFLVNAIELVEKIYDRPTREKFISRALNTARLHNCKKFVCGHFHPKDRIIIEREGVVIEILPRGRHLVDVI